MKEFRGYSHGINLGGWLSQCDHTKERYDNFITQEDLRIIAQWGLDHVRIPVDYNLVQDENGRCIEEGFKYIEKALEWCGKYGLNMILDLHKTFGYSFDKGEQEAGFFDNEDYQERFYTLWEEFAKRFGSYSNRLAFELLNEVTDKEFSDKWNKISTRCIEAIRAFAPDIKILLGGYYNNSIEALKDLPYPVDENVVYNFHCYEPLIFTHQGAPWVDKMDTDFRMPFESTYGEYIDNTAANTLLTAKEMAGFDREALLGDEYFEMLVSEAVRVANERKVALYCGEFGVINRAAPEDALKWYRMICRCLDKYGIARAAWSYREMDFGIADKNMDAVREDILEVL